MLSKNFVGLLLVLIQVSQSIADYQVVPPSTTTPAAYPTAPSVSPKKVYKCVRKPKTGIPAPVPTSSERPAPAEALKETVSEPGPATAEPATQAPETPVATLEEPKEPTPEPKPAQSPPQTQESTPGFSPEDILKETNQIRAQYGKSPVELHPALNAEALNQAKYQQSIDKMTHDRPAGTDMRTNLENFGLKTGVFAENAVAGTETSHDAMNSWMGSDAHRDNILGDYKLIGAGKAGRYSTLIFANPA